MPFKETLGKYLAPFQLRSLPRRRDYSQTVASKFVGYAKYNRLLGADDGQISVKALGQLHQTADIIGLSGNALCILRYSPISGSTPKLRH